MLEIMFESEDIFNEFTIHIPIKLLYQTDKELFAIEDWSFDNNLLTLPKNSDGETIKQAKNIVRAFLDNTANVSVDKIINYYNNITSYNYIKKNPYMGGTGKTNDTVDVSYYIPMSCDISNIDCSDKIRESLSKFTIRVANHISKDEERSLKSYDNVKLYHQQVIGLYEQLFSDYTFNILKFYTKFLNTLSEYNQHIETFDDIHKNDIDILKSIAIQGEF